AAETWLCLADPSSESGLAGLSHRDALARPRPLSEPFLRLIADIEGLLDVVLARFEARYVAYIRRLDALLEKPAPTADDIRILYRFSSLAGLALPGQDGRRSRGSDESASLLRPDPPVSPAPTDFAALRRLCRGPSLGGSARGAPRDLPCFGPRVRRGHALRALTLSVPVGNGLPYLSRPRQPASFPYRALFTIPLFPRINDMAARLSSI